MAQRNRIRWHCRRGLLELDLVLEGFLERCLDRLSAEQMQLFGELLEWPDNDLLDLAMGRAEPEPRFRELVEMLRAA